MGVGVTIVQALWFIWPAYTANAAPTIVRGKMPLDFGRKFGKNRLLGDGKTVEGTVFGVAFGILVGVVQMSIISYMPANLGLFRFTILEVSLLSAGAMVGDIIGSFIKRRLGIARGKPFFIIDQIGFLIAALILVSLLFVPDINMIVALLVITPAIHLLTNIVGYALKLKKNPW